MSDTIDRQMAISALRYAQHRFVVADEAGGLGTVKWSENVIFWDAAKRVLEDLPSAKQKQQWIPCSEKLPEINQTVLLSTTDGEVIVGYRYKPDIVWQVTANDGRKIWVYDPENYSGNIDELPKAETCGFEDRDNCWLSVTSINYDKKFAGISAWMPLPHPYREVSE